MSFRLKTILGIAAIELSVMAILIVINQLNYGGTASAQLYERARSTGELFATMTADAVIATDLATLDSMIENTLEHDEIVYLRVRHESGAVLSEGGDASALDAPFRQDKDFEAARSDHRIDVLAQIAVAGQVFGAVEIGISTSVVEAQIASAVNWNIIIALIGVTLVAIFGYLLGSALTVQLSSLRIGARMLAAGKLQYQIPVHGRDELADTANCFNDMARTLAAKRTALELKQSELLEKRDRTALIAERMKEIASGTPEIEVPDSDRPDEIGDMARATVVFQEAMLAVQQARAEQARLIQAFDQLDEQVVIYGETGRAIFLNASFRRFNTAILENLETDFEFADFLSEGIRQGAFPSAIGQEDEWLAWRLSDTDEESLPFELMRAPDRTLLVRRTSVAGIGTIISASDVTDLKTSQAQLIQASKLATLGEMATGIAHELNQPLGIIRMASNNSAKRVAKGQIDADYLTAKLERISEQTERAAQIINHMRIFGRTSDGEVRTFDLAASVENACTLMSRQLSATGILLTQEIATGSAAVDGQQVMFEQVILNLLNNARDAIEDHRGSAEGGDIHVSLVEQSEDFWSISVADSGGGVPEAILDRLFDPFFTTKEPGKGTGLGLSISYGIIRDMGGTIAATNTTRGARFRIDLPKSRAGMGIKAA